MSIRGSHQRSTTATTTAAHPFGGPAHTSGAGIPLGFYHRTNEEFRFDPFIEKSNGTIMSTNGIFLGPKGFGKSTAFKIMAWRLFMISAGHGQMKVAVNDHKPEDRESEYAALGRHLGCDTYDIATRSVNPFESRLKLGELNVLEMATLLCEHVSQRRLVGGDFEALKVGVYKMLELPEKLWSPQVLQKMCLSISTQDIADYYTNMHNRMREQLVERIDRLASHEGEKIGYLTEISHIYERSDNVRIETIVHSGEYIASLLSTLLEGKYGKMLGGQDSLYEMLTKKAIIKDWRGVTSDAVSLMRAIDHRIQINAIEKGILDLYPNIELDDEDHRSMENLTYARSKALQSKILRSARKLNLSGSHRLSDYRKGGTGSELWGYGESIIDDMAFYFVGRQNNKKADLDELQDRLGISDLDRHTLTRLPKYVFGVKLGEEEPLKYIQFLPTESERAFIGTNAANDAMVNRPGIRPSEYAQVAHETGTRLKKEGND